MLQLNPFILLIGTALLISSISSHSNRMQKYFPELGNDLSLWIDEQQVKRFSGYSIKIFAIENGKVSPHLKNPNFNHNLPLIPSEVSSVNFTWCSRTKKYRYHFDRLQSYDETILKPPSVSIKSEGNVPKKAKGM